MSKARTSPSRSPAPPNGDTKAIGARLRKARLKAGLTLEKVSGAAGLTAGHLSRLERGSKQPSVGALLALARALGATSGALMGADPGKGELLIGRAGRGTRLGRTPVSAEFRYEVLLQEASCAGQAVTAFIVHPNAEGGTVVEVSHQGLELVFVLSGAIEIVFAERVVSLGQGDVMLFPGYLRHRTRCQSNKPASALVVMMGV